MPKRRKRRWLRWLGYALIVLLAALIAARLAMPRFVRWYVNGVIDRSPLYDGEIGGVEINLWRGAYAITEVRLNKKTGNVPVPLFAAKRIDLAVEWPALRHGKIVGRVLMESPEINFVDSKGADSAANAQTGADGPWLSMLRDLFPFKINSCEIRDGSVHFRAAATDPPVDVYLSQLDASVENLTNVRDELTPLITRISAKALAMDQARFELEMNVNPFSYRPTFQLVTRLIGLDVTKVNALTRAYGAFDFEDGFFDLVVQADATEGAIDGYVKPLFRNVRIFSLDPDIKEDNVLEFFWEALVGGATKVLSNQGRDQFGTLIPFSGDLTTPQTDLLATVGNVLRNAFIRAYLPRLEADQSSETSNVLHFQPGRLLEPGSASEQ